MIILGTFRSSTCYHSCHGQFDTKNKPIFFIFKMAIMFNRVINKINIKIITIINKYLFSIHFYSRLIRYLYPTDQQLKNIAGIPKEKPKKNSKHENGKKTETFQIRRSLDIKLETTKVSELDVIHLKYYTEFQWLLDFSIYAVITYTLTEVCMN